MNWKDEIIKGIEPSGFFKELDNKKQLKQKKNGKRRNIKQTNSIRHSIIQA